METEEAIEKLAKYRTDSKARIDDKEDKIQEPNPLVEKFRYLAIRLTWFNIFIFSGLTVFTAVAGLITGKVMAIPAAIISGIVARQTLKSNIRLTATHGRRTSFDDAFMILLGPLLLLAVYLFDYLNNMTFITVHIILTLIWFLQIYFLFFTKPDVRYRKEHLVAKYEDTLILDTTKKFVLGLGALMGVLLSIPAI